MAMFVEKDERASATLVLRLRRRGGHCFCAADLRGVVACSDLS